jgi:hypothetical protein
MLEDLVELANHLDQKGLYKEADALDSIIKQAGLWDLLSFKQTSRRPKRSHEEEFLDNLQEEINLIKDEIEEENSQEKLENLKAKKEMLEAMKLQYIENYYFRQRK